jgi:hypothetical protein
LRKFMGEWRKPTMSSWVGEYCDFRHAFLKIWFYIIHFQKDWRGWLWEFKWKKAWECFV